LIKSTFASQVHQQTKEIECDWKLQMEWGYLGWVIRSIRKNPLLHHSNWFPSPTAQSWSPPRDHANTNQLSNFATAARLASTSWKCPAVVKTVQNCQNTRTQLVHWHTKSYDTFSEATLSKRKKLATISAQCRRVHGEEAWRFWFKPSFYSKEGRTIFKSQKGPKTWSGVFIICY